MENDIYLFYIVVASVLPVTVVGVYFYYMLRMMIDGELRRKDADLLMKRQELTVPVRLDAYERLSLLVERSSILSLVGRCPMEGKGVLEYKVDLMSALHSEYNHNTTQQIYVSTELWMLIKDLRDTLSNFIALSSKVSVERGDSLEGYVNELMAGEESVAGKVNVILEVIKKEINIVAL